MGPDLVKIFFFQKVTFKIEKMVKKILRKIVKIDRLQTQLPRVGRLSNFD
jgi:hypothetical protein